MSGNTRATFSSKTKSLTCARGVAKRRSTSLMVCPVVAQRTPFYLKPGALRRLGVAASRWRIGLGEGDRQRKLDGNVDQLYSLAVEVMPYWWLSAARLARPGRCSNQLRNDSQ